TIGGTVTYHFFQNGVEVGTGETVAVGNDASATGNLAAGSYKYTVHYSGDANYNASDSGDELLTIDKADTSTATAIELNGTETEVTSVALGTNVQDDATVSSSTPGTITGMVTYTFYKETGAQAGLQTSGPNADTVVHTDTKSVGTDSDPTG